MDDPDHKHVRWHWDEPHCIMKTMEERDKAGWPPYEKCMEHLNPFEKRLADMAMDAEEENWHPWFDYCDDYPFNDFQLDRRPEKDELENEPVDRGNCWLSLQQHP